MTGGSTAGQVDGAQRAPSLPSVLIVTREVARRGALAEEAARRGMRAAFAADATDVAVQVQRHDPAAAVVVAGPDGAVPVLRALRRIPTILLATGDAFGDRIVAARLGAEGYLDIATPAADVIDQVALAVERHATTGATVLVLEPDPGGRAEATDALAGDGFDVQGLASAAELWQTLEQVQPALLVLPAELPDVSGVDLCRVLRSDPRWRVVPLVFRMAADAPAAAVDELFAAGASDCLLGDADELRVRARSHVERFRLHQALAETDPLTGLANRRTSTAMLGQLMRLADRLGQPLCLAEIDIDHFKGVNDRYGHLVGDQALRRLSEVLRRRFRGEDVIARWGGEEFIVGMLGLDRIEGVDRLADVLTEFSGEHFETSNGDTFRLTFSGGVAQFPLDGSDLEALYQAADDALYVAKGRGRNQIVAAHSEGGASQQMVDVAVIEDDDATATLLGVALSDGGCRWWRFSNGAGAAATLGGEAARLRARVILLDIDLPAIDGFELLGLLARDGVLEHSKVICVTGNGHKRAEERARELGAEDYVVKPFDIGDLVRRVQAALGR